MYRDVVPLLLLVVVIRGIVLLLSVDVAIAHAAVVVADNQADARMRLEQWRDHVPRRVVDDVVDVVVDSNVVRDNIRRADDVEFARHRNHVVGLLHAVA
jgi:hypothetical protein